MEDFDLLSFPPEILANIFSNIPWNQLINVKLTARKFNNVTEKYLKHMQKPKLRAIYFNDNFIYNDGIEKIKVGYVIITNSVNEIHYTTDRKEFFLLPSELDQLHNFLKKVDLTFLNLVHIKIDIHIKVIRIFSDYFRNTNTIDDVYFIVRNSDICLDDILPFF
uniref:F-box domain-containing protein n=1 Tax=Strongyloides venezuelensis TaxID=75913 RepID=A0A0K0FGS5_STRVS